MLLSERGNLLVWTVYDHPRDFPDHFVARAHEVDGEHENGVPTDKVLIERQLYALRHRLELLGLVKMDRDPQDQPHIVEVWL